MNVPTHLSLFSGIGGLDIAAEMAGFRTVGQCEWADYPTKVLEKHWPDVPRWRDIRTLTGGSFYERTGLRTVDVVSGGFPCQPFSVAGKRRGKEDDRYLWPEMLRVVQELRPAWVVGENVAGIVNMALDEVLSDLESIGYACQAFIIPACAVDAPHRRDRCAIIANRDGIRCIMRGYKGQGVHGDQTCNETDTGSQTMAYANRAGLQGREQYGTSDASGQKEPQIPVEQCSQIMADTDNRGRSLWRDGELPAVEETATSWADHRGRAAEYVSGEWWPAQSGLGRVVDGVPAWVDGYWLNEPDIPRITTEKKNRADRLKCLGNAVVWRQFYPIFEAIKRRSIMKPIYVPTGAAKEYGDYALNIYTGCPHNCFYCYAPKILRKSKEQFHENVMPRIDIVKQTESQIIREKITGKTIHLCFTCDPYPTGVNTNITREIILVLKKYGNHVQLLTKGDGSRDFDILDSNDWYGITLDGIKKRLCSVRSKSKCPCSSTFQRHKNVGII